MPEPEPRYPSMEQRSPRPPEYDWLEPVRTWLADRAKYGPFRDEKTANRAVAFLLGLADEYTKPGVARMAWDIAHSDEMSLDEREELQKRVASLPARVVLRAPKEDTRLSRWEAIYRDFPGSKTKGMKEPRDAAAEILRSQKEPYPWDLPDVKTNPGIVGRGLWWAALAGLPLAGKAIKDRLLPESPESSWKESISRGW